MYFNHSFKKEFLSKSTNGFIGSEQTDAGKFSNVLSGGTAGLLNVGDFGAFAAKDDIDQATGAWDAYQVLIADTNAAGAANAAVNKLSSLTANEGFYLQGKSFRTSDTIGSNPGHGGYTESWKSKMILPKYINKLWKTNCEAAQAQKIELRATTTANKSCFKCAETGTNNFIRVDVKGSPALRFLNHNVYRTLDTGASCTACYGDYMNPIYAYKQFAIGICDDPQLNKFIQVNKLVYNDGTGGVDVTVLTCATIKTDAALTTASLLDTWSATMTAVIEIEAAYVDTEFGTCSFDTRDGDPTNATFGEPLLMSVEFQNEDGNQCWCASSDGTTAAVETQAARKANGTPYQVLKGLIQTDGYMQNPYNQGNKDSSRFREIEGSDQIYAAMDMTSTYGSYNLVHSVPRFNNPTGVFDNDQYHYKINMPCGQMPAVTADPDNSLDRMFKALETNSGIDFETLGDY